MIQVTSSAIEKLKQIKKDEKRAPEEFLRVKVRKGGCSGLSYQLEFDRELKDGDQVIQPDPELKVVLDRDAFMYLVGMRLDFSGGLNGKGFIFDNPNASKTCGCGSSFNV